MLDGIKFVYEEPALIAHVSGKDYLVVADLHIGMEISLSSRGIHVFNSTERMAERINHILHEFSINSLIILGDVKDSVLYPENPEARLLKGFFDRLRVAEIKIIAGNHDAHLSDIIGHDVYKELIIGNVGFLHGNRKPDEKMMKLDYMISAHEHVAVRIVEKSGAVYEQKAWAIYKLDRKKAESSYKDFNKNIRLISMPAFNDLIMGTTVCKEKSTERLNPLLNSSIFSYRSMGLYSLLGQRITLH